MPYQRMDEQIVRENTEQCLTVRFGTALVPSSTTHSKRAKAVNLKLSQSVNKLGTGHSCPVMQI
ncbi:hypothetical protein M514_08503 [Trichuris suis]|uniref:Uncharacterized protein n=1 Tax=Trichuris suis TaxID=68888 RepID=A0A085MVM9_9BILA|nr:hypothetical protein M513_08503 [Trichuris suis]KFD61275.1 hypothetical protein M514_08503 [Trichuris suis]